MIDLDVVIVTLLRKSLKNTLKSVNDTIPSPSIILITDKGVIGDLRNKGLAQCHSEYVCFVDDDIILNKTWFSKCMARLVEDQEVIAVAGRTQEIYTCGCMICKTKEFKDAGGFPRLDSYLSKKLGKRTVTLEDAVCEHIMPRGLSVVEHHLHWLTHGFQTEKKAGIYNNPAESMRLTVRFLKKGLPEQAICQPLWIVKAFFVLPFVLRDKPKQTQ